MSTGLSFRLHVDGNHESQIFRGLMEKSHELRRSGDRNGATMVLLEASEYNLTDQTWIMFSKLSHMHSDGHWKDLVHETKKRIDQM